MKKSNILAMRGVHAAENQLVHVFVEGLLKRPGVEGSLKRPASIPALKASSIGRAGENGCKGRANGGRSRAGPSRTSSFFVAGLGDNLVDLE